MKYACNYDDKQNGTKSKQTAEKTDKTSIHLKTSQ